MDYVVLDVREPAEYASGHVKGAINVPPSTLLAGENELSHIPKDANIIVYCRSGSRSNVAMQMLQQMGYKHIENGINQGQVEAKYGL